MFTLLYSGEKKGYLPEFFNLSSHYYAFCNVGAYLVRIMIIWRSSGVEVNLKVGNNSALTAEVS